MTDDTTQQFVKDLASQIENDLIYRGNLSSNTLLFWETVKYSQEYLGLIEQSLDLPVTGDLIQLVDNYKQSYYTKNCTDFHGPDFCFVGAAKYGDLDNLNKLQPQLLFPDKSLENGLKAAAENGQTEVVKILSQLIRNPNVIGEALVLAATNHQLESVQELSSWAYVERLSVYSDIHRAVEVAANKGYFDIIKALSYRQFNQDEMLHTLIKAVEYDKLDEIEFLFGRFDKHNPNFKNLMLRAIKEEDLNLLKGVIFFNRDFIENAMVEASKTGKLTVAKFLVERYPTFSLLSDIGLRLAARYGHINILSYLLSSNQNLSNKVRDILYIAAENKQLGVLEWASQLNNFDESLNAAMIKAIEHNEYETLRTLGSMAYPSNLASIANYYIRRGDIYLGSIKTLAKKTGAASSSNEDLLGWAAAIGSLDLVRYLIERKKVDPNYGDRLALRSAEAYNQSDVVEYLSKL
jgi:ankyrin repeat protein